MRFNEVRIADETLRVMLEAGALLRDAGRLEEAEKILRGVHEFAPTSDVPLVGLGKLELQRGRCVEALAFYDEALRLHPESAYARVHRAEALLVQGKREEAETELRELIEQDPTSPHARTAQALLDAADLIGGTAR
ncbi:tetratricopeptide repeat protein [Pyrinomonas sp.]|uniref:tetratricopeptide repeat protein n=1 Tax=Pyrinomonas sp. TaxID=2080306 RepID=UPI0033260F09